MKITKLILTVFILIVILSCVVGPTHADLVANGDGTITDTDTNLMWLQDGNNVCSYFDSTCWQNSINGSGYNDWRQPVIEELQHLFIAHSITNTSSTPFVNISGMGSISDNYWSSSQGPLSGTLQVFDFASGNIGVLNHVGSPPNDYSLHILPVRIAVVPEPLSSSLFLAGSGVLAVRRYMRKKK